MIEILAGRDFYKKFSADQNSVIINNTALELLGYKTPEEAVDDEIIYRDSPFKTNGVISNYHQQSLKENYDPLFLVRFLWAANFSVKVSTRDLPKTISSIQNVFNSVFPGYLFEYFFLDEHFNSQYRTDLQFGKILSLFSLLAIFIGCLGLFGLSSYETILRTKEIGIRKVLGASIQGILKLLLKETAFLILMAFVITLPMSYFYFNKWLKNYAFRIRIGWWFFFFPLTLILFIALFAVGYNTLKASLANPVDNLRYE